jgi:hypothetical protein
VWSRAQPGSVSRGWTSAATQEAAILHHRALPTLRALRRTCSDPRPLTTGRAPALAAEAAEREHRM